MIDDNTSTTGSGGDPADLADQARQALEQGETGQAVELMYQAVTLAPGSAALQSELGLALEAAGQLPAAKAAQQTAVQLDPDNPVHHYNLGAICQALGEAHEAASHYVNALEREPVFAQAYYNLATLFYEAGHFDVAAEHYRNALTAHPDYAEAASNLGLSLRRLGRQAEAIDSYRAALAMRPDLAITHANLGIVLAEAGRFDEAVACYGRALALEPENPSHHINLSLAWRGSGRVELAAESALRALMADRSYIPTHVELGSVAAVLQRHGLVAEARDLLRRWRMLAGDHPVLRHAEAALGLAPAPERATDDYVERVFDASARRFDEMIGALGYQVPSLMEQALEQRVGPANANRDVLDAGCGTGLLAPVLRPYARRLTGVDLSLAMLEQANRRGLYDALEREEIGAYMTARPQMNDLVVLGDVLCYFGALESVFAAIAVTLRSGGHAFFTLERAPEGEAPHVLRESGRYAHHPAYVQDVVAGAGLTLSDLAEVELRYESGQPVAGLLVVAIKP